MSPRGEYQMSVDTVEVRHGITASCGRCPLEVTGPACPREAWRRRRGAQLPNHSSGPTAPQQCVAAKRARCQDKSAECGS